LALTAQGHKGLGDIEAAMSWREEVRDRIAELEHLRLLLEETRISARNVGGAEGERLEAKVGASIRRLSNQIDDLRASLE
jgi:hypothetical protein